MSYNERRAKWLATWASMGLEAANYLRDRGQESDGENLERTVNMILDLAENEIGEDFVRAAIQEITDQWCEGEDLANDYFADDGSPTIKLLP